MIALCFYGCAWWRTSLARKVCTVTPTNALGFSHLRFYPTPNWSAPLKRSMLIITHQELSIREGCGKMRGTRWSNDDPARRQRPQSTLRQSGVPARIYITQSTADSCRIFRRVCGTITRHCSLRCSRSGKACAIPLVVVLLALGVIVKSTAYIPMGVAAVRGFLQEERRSLQQPRKF